MNLQIIWQFLSQLALSHWILYVFLPGSLIAFCWFRKYIKIQIRFGRNLKRKIYFLKTSEAKKLSVEKNTLSKLKIFHLDKNIRDISDNLKELQTLKKKAVYIIGYDDGYNKYKDLFDEAKGANIPIIVFANSGEIKKEEHWDIFNEYIYCDVANTTNRVAVILMSIMKIIPSHGA
ncbi:hypothetical protein [Desulfobacter curvatus]|uniref:hypothetical protein n=1 Tax=Desulfobacter curvatus TaxID=2290 RepID=UPI00037596F8|nr:hypothetical protein [Desulfobacter curvatus]